MKLKLAITALLCSLVLIAAGCSARDEAPRGSESEASTEEELNSPEPEPEPSPYQDVEARVVSLMEHMADSSTRFMLLGTLEAGAEADLDRWYEAISATSPDNLAYLYISDMQEEGYDLTPEQVDAVIGGLKGAYLDVFEETALGNPATGGSTIVVALDEEQEVLWKVSFDSQWFIVEMDEESRVFDASPASDRLVQMRQALEEQA